MGCMDFIDPGGVGRSVLNPGGSMDWAMPYVGAAGAGIGSIIGGAYGGAPGAALGGGIGGFGGSQLGGYFSKDPKFEQDPWTGKALGKAAITGGIGAGAGYAGASLAGAGGAGAGAGETGMSATDAAFAAEGGGGYYGGLYPGITEGATEAVPVASSSIYGAGAPLRGGGPELGTSPSTGGGVPAGGGAGTISKGMLGGYGKYLPYMMGGGMLLNAAGNYMNAENVKSGQEAYRSATSWTPERTSAYMSNLQNLIGGLYSTEETKRKKTIAEALAGAGRGGGGMGAASERLGREKRGEMAKALAAGALATSAPPNQPLEAFVSPSWGGQTLTGASGMLGQGSNALITMALLQQLYGGR